MYCWQITAQIVEKLSSKKELYLHDKVKMWSWNTFYDAKQKQNLLKRSKRKWRVSDRAETLLCNGDTHPPPTRQQTHSHLQTVAFMLLSKWDISKWAWWRFQLAPAILNSHCCGSRVYLKCNCPVCVCWRMTWLAGPTVLLVVTLCVSSAQDNG